MKESIMKKYIVCIIAAVIACLFITGCGQSTPKGTDSEVKETVIQIARGEFRKQMLLQFGVDNSYAELKKLADTDKQAAKQVKGIDTIMSKVKMSLENVLMNNIDDKIMKSSSGATLIVNLPPDKTLKMPINYTAQLNDKGEVYVEVTGIKF
jgi:signal transduction histidine kinase